jgi:hypothetical protein
MFYVILDTLLKESLNTNKTGQQCVKYNVEHGDQFFGALPHFQQCVRYNVEHGHQFYWCLTTLSTMCQV